jgi:hypothetical protein
MPCACVPFTLATLLLYLIFGFMLGLGVMAIAVAQCMRWLVDLDIIGLFGFGGVRRVGLVVGRCTCSMDLLMAAVMLAACMAFRP